MDSYTTNHHCVAHYYVAMEEANDGEVEDALATLADQCRHYDSDRARVAIKRLGGDPPARVVGRAGEPFPLDYELPLFEHPELTRSLAEALAALEPHQLHFVCLMGRTARMGRTHP